MGTPTDRERDDELFSPSLTQTERRELAAGEKPWRLGSQFYVAFFGGPLAAGAIGYLNGRRLGLSRERLWALPALGIAGFLACLAATAAFIEADAGRSPRLVVAATGVATYLAVRQLQKDADRRYGINRNEGDAYDSLWAPGLVAVLVCGITSLVVLAGIA